MAEPLPKMTQTLADDINGATNNTSRLVYICAIYEDGSESILSAPDVSGEKLTDYQPPKGGHIEVQVLQNSAYVQYELDATPDPSQYLIWRKQGSYHFKFAWTEKVAISPVAPQAKIIAKAGANPARTRKARKR